MERLLRNVNAANAITMARILLVPVFVVFLVVEIPYGYVVAIALFSSPPSPTRSTATSRARATA